MPVAPPVALARSTAAALGLVIVVDAADIVVHGQLLIFVRRLLLDGNAVSDEQLAANDALTNQLALFSLGAMALVAVLFVAWLHRSVVFQRDALHSEPRFGSGWAVGAWFVPFLNLLRPKQIVDDVWRDTSAAADGRERSHRVLDAWWACLLASAAAARIAGVLHPDTLDGLRAATYVDIAVDVFDISAAALAMTIVLRLIDMQGRAAEAVIERQRRLAANPPVGSQDRQGARR